MKKRLFIKTTLYILIAIIIVICLSLSSVFAYFTTYQKPNNLTDTNNNIQTFKYNAFRYKKYQNISNEIINNNTVILNPTNNKLYCSIRVLSQTDPYHNPDIIPVGNYKKSTVSSLIAYFEITPHFSKYNIYKQGDFVYRKEDNKVYKRSRDLGPRFDYYPIVTSTYEVLNYEANIPGSSAYWQVTDDDLFIWKKYNLYRKYDVVSYKNRYWYCKKNQLFDPNGPPPSTLSNGNENWARVRQAPSVNRKYPIYTILFKEINSEYKLFQAVNNNANSNSLTDTTQWKEISFRI